MHAFLSNLANRQTDRQTRAKHVPPFVGGNKLNQMHPSDAQKMMVQKKTAELPFSSVHMQITELRL